MRSQIRQLLDHARPDDADAAFRAGAIAVKRGYGDEAVPLMQAAARDHPADARLWQVLGLAFRQLEDLAPAVEALENAAGLSPQDPLIAHALARATLEAGLPASDRFDRARLLAPNDPSILLGLAAARFADGRSDDAIAGLDEQLRRNPGWLLGHVTVSRLRWMCGDRETFPISFERALEVAPREAGIWHQFVATLMDGKLYEQALDVVARGRVSAGETPYFDAAEAICMAESGRTEQADHCFAKLQPIHDLPLIISYVRHLLRTGRPADAATLAESRLADAGNDMWPYLAAAWRLTGDSRWEWLETDPHFIGVYDIGDKIGSIDELAALLRRLHLATQQPLEQSLRGGTQTDGPLFARIEPEIRALRRAIVQAVQDHVAQLPRYDAHHPLLGTPRSPLRFSGSWSVRLLDKGYHSNHVHAAGWISSAFYVALPELGAESDEHAGWLTLGEVSELGLDLEPIRLIEPKVGRLALFPSTMWHGTRPFEAGERLTVAFDIARPLP